MPSSPSKGNGIKWRALSAMPRVEKVLADQGDRGKRPQQIGQFYQVDFELTTKLGVGFAVEPKRWIVERTLAWLDNARRLDRDGRTIT